MPNVLKALRAEIRKVAKAESKRASQPLRDQLRGIRRSLTLIENRLQALKAGRAAATAPNAGAGDGDGRRARFAPALMKQHRAKVGLSRRAYAQLLGVSSLTIYFWETGRTKPRRAAVLAWQSLRKRGVRALRAQAGVPGAGVATKRAPSRRTKSTAKKAARNGKKRTVRRARRAPRGVRAKAA